MLEEKHPSILFSILIANYNNGRYLEECIRSIVAQTYHNWEVVIVDDGSTDESKSIYERYAYDARFRIFFNDRNRGCGFTKRRCAELAKGELCGFVDPDDALTPNAMETLVLAHQNNPDNSLIYSNHFICDNVLNVIKVADYVGQIPEKLKSWEVNFPTISHFASFRRDKYLRSGGIYPWLSKAVDKNLYYKLETTGSSLYIDKPLYYYRHHSGSISLYFKSSYASMMQISLKTLLLIDHPKAIQNNLQFPQSKMKMAGALMLTGFYVFFKNRKYKSGFSLIIKALKFQPVFSTIYPIWQIGSFLWKRYTHTKLPSNAI